MQVTMGRTAAPFAGPRRCFAHVRLAGGSPASLRAGRALRLKGDGIAGARLAVRDRAGRAAARLATPVVAVAAPEVAVKRVYNFGKGKNDGDASMKSLLGGKGANLAEMCGIGLAVPPGFTITTETCRAFHNNDRTLPEGCWEDTLAALKVVEEEMGQKFGDAANPLLLSVRSGAAVSMPGMMDTVLNLGLSDNVVEGLAAKAGGRFAYDAYRRFLDMFGNVVMGVPHELFEEQLEAMKKEKGVEFDTDLSAEDMKEVAHRYKQVYVDQGTQFPDDPYDQLRASIYAVFDSWESDRAKVYRQVAKLTGLGGTAVNVQTMAFGNMGDTSATGVLFTRNPANGDKHLYGEYLMNAQGEDVVAGIRTPLHIDDMKAEMPQMYDELVRNCDLLERHYKEMQDIEFTIQEGKLFMLQCRTGKRTGMSAVKIAVAMVDEGLITPEEAVLKVDANHLDQLLHPQFEDEAAYKDRVVATGLPASPGASVGQVVFTADDAETMKASGHDVILVRKETSPEDVKGMHSSEGVVTQLGGMTSHAAVVARGWGKTCITGCGDLQIDEGNGSCRFGNTVVNEHDWISINGTTGEVIVGKCPLKQPEMVGDLGRFMHWVDQFRTMGVYTNADTPEDAAMARENGAEGIGLCRTEHMFFATEERIKTVRKMIVAQSKEDRVKALDELLPFQRSDFEGLFTAMDGLPVTIRLLDPPLHEFLPDGDMDEVVEMLARETGGKPADIAETIERLEELNPMLGFRGCRLAITYPEIAEMQARAILEAAVNVSKKGVKVQPDIMVPLIGTSAELKNQESLVRRMAEKVFEEKGTRVDYRVGTMIEIPRAALLADQVAETAEFFSFGTNDLTQMTFGYSRDDIGKFLQVYLDKGILQVDPFQVLDEEGVGQLIKMATEKGRATRPNLKVGLCGEQGGDPASVKFVYAVGLDYVSCSPFRVPIARLAAAQASVLDKKK
ncbi:unnamed protein product [Ostreobium quekettii]|uniref:Pyruvate, phosphate dikinase n=1 Tax=Ostreobium quekettii TaxID=121088 RepID=A0A8S1J6P4_9CHLO|nr:unnamed protein product [Ostreobium quekettii]|eukprot:evm.model.scf_358EXC.4 EVM.evm.TU.scf_358EXC.4   scf_358EXC:44327-52100(+)